MKIKKNDNVYIISGKDVGKRGTVEKVFPREGKLTVIGANVLKAHLKPSKKNPQGGIIDKLGKINQSNVMVICPHCGKIVRTGYKVNNKTKERICRKCSGNLDVREKNAKS